VDIRLNSVNSHAHLLLLLALFGTGLSTCGMLSQKILLQPHPWQCLKLD